MGDLFSRDTLDAIGTILRAPGGWSVALLAALGFLAFVWFLVDIVGTFLLRLSPGNLWLAYQRSVERRRRHVQHRREYERARMELAARVPRHGGSR